MKRILILFLWVGVAVQAQSNQELINHYKAYYKQMQKQADAQGVINALTHLNVLQPSTQRQDTLAYVYMSEGMYFQALNTSGIELNPTDSDMSVEVKAVSLKAMKQVEKAIPFFEELFKREATVGVAYELAEMYLQTQQLLQATKYVEYGIENSKPEVGRTYYESQQPYQVPIKAGFLYLKALVTFNKNKATNIDTAITTLDEAITLAPNFNLAYITKQALQGQKNPPQPETKN
ncbi:tetratricopeptide repeat protein [Mangrovimonas futianensis]|uniref:tetratricopeptide repeat protein n=1 Tax=Mangrovimonas futianensis TaxID=2895523 RepID=UPI001E375314|nr:hypothetical protein [Mangrovimonas futianensis]MCF1421813.1 hypothetical protein [Mangrovimonas futianensis]